jgi:hypothetical protein
MIELQTEEKMAEIIEYIPELKGVDAEIFLRKLEQDITPDEIKEVRKWALGTNSTIE